MADQRIDGFRIIRDYWGAVVSVGAALLMVGGLQWQTAALADQASKRDALISENEDAIEDIQRSLIRRQGEIGLDLERLKIEQSQQSEKLDDVLLLLRQLRVNSPSSP